MLKDRSIYTVLPAKDLERARSFYKEKLGFEPSDERDGEVFYSTPSGTNIRLYETENAGSAQHTQLGWVTDDLDREMQELRDRGVTFEDYDFPGLTTENGVAESDVERAAWFHDSEGNMLCVSQSRR